MKILASLFIVRKDGSNAPAISERSNLRSVYAPGPYTHGANYQIDLNLVHGIPMVGAFMDISYWTHGKWTPSFFLF